MADLLAKARTAQRCGFHSLWVGPGYLHNGMPLTDALQAISASGARCCRALPLPSDRGA
jgi:hypothetical protein